jgi:tryptophan-rich sensory protein
MNGPLFAAFSIAIGAVWVILMFLPGIGHPPVSREKNESEETAKDKKKDDPAS